MVEELFFWLIIILAFLAVWRFISGIVRGFPFRTCFQDNIMLSALFILMLAGFASTEIMWLALVLLSLELIFCAMVVVPIIFNDLWPGRTNGSYSDFLKKRLAEPSEKKAG
ncbi:hypothetical protein COB52_01070 [Candidatus Kaiserbacteria bacterium]|nr:MAG: hypothetical protein COB52_01070 [Candidatus Kaiserbacteria bacterium]